MLAITDEEIVYILKAKGVRKYIKEGLLTFEQAMKLSIRAKINLDNSTIQDGIAKNWFSIAQAINFSNEDCKILEKIMPISEEALSCAYPASYEKLWRSEKTFFLQR